ncbi:MAG TPA: NAD(P)H-binding protein [Streptosporangiaceae bacterium]|nr:NAD(P)H-binding protein [Streptosporangiaceae bacterium]
MKITVFGASGGIGGEVVRQALDSGHKVTAVIRESSGFGVQHPSLEIVRVAGLTDPEALQPALEASDAAISGVGPRSRKDGPVASTTVGGILQALEASRVERFVAVSAVPAGPVPEGDSFVNRRLLLPFISVMLRDTYADLTAMEQAIARSSADWTVIRPPKLVDKPLTGQYRTRIGSNVPRGYTAGRADVAHLMLAVLDDPATIGQPVGIAY